MIKIVAVIIAIALILLNAVTWLSGVTDEGIWGIIFVIVGGGLIAYQFRRGRDFAGRVGWLSWLMPIFGLWYTLKGAYAGLLLLMR